MASGERLQGLTPEIDGRGREVLAHPLSDLLVELVLVDVSLAVGRDDAVDLVAHFHERGFDESDSQVLDGEVNDG